jgi:hypothetical protein
MKNQYVGDENDYRKYGLLRCLADGNEMSIGVVWMLTEDDGGKDGGKIDYLDKPWQWKQHDEPLFKGLTDIVKESRERNVRQVQDLDLLPHADYFEEVLMDDVQHRRLFFAKGFERLVGKDLLFFDPDNGMEVPSKPLGIKGRKDSCKYLYFPEIEEAFQRGHSLLIYQHFPRKKRHAYIQQRTSELFDKVKGIDAIFSFSTSNVCFFLVSQEKHTQYFQGRLGDIATGWGRQFAVSVHEKVGAPFVRDSGCPLTVMSRNHL